MSARVGRGVEWLCAGVSERLEIKSHACPESVAKV